MLDEPRRIKTAVKGIPALLGGHGAQEVSSGGDRLSQPSAFSRGIGEYGSVVFIAGNMPFETEIAPLMIMTKSACQRLGRLSPVVAGLFFIMLFGRMSPLYSTLQDFHVAIVFAVPGVILATVFVMFPFITRELIPVMSKLNDRFGATGIAIMSSIG